MSEKIFDAHLPALEQAGWEPGAIWVPTIEQQSEIDIRLEAEQITNYAESLNDLLDDDETTDWVPMGSEEREAEIQKNIEFLKSKADYMNRPLDVIVSEILAWLEAFMDSPERWTTEGALEREAAAFLEKIADNDQGLSIDPILKALTIRWATIQHVMYHYERAWMEDVSYEQAVQAVERAGLSVEEFNNLLVDPLDSKAEVLIISDPGVDVISANMLALESQMIERAEEIGVNASPIHPYATFLYQFGR